jgi:beta-glucosidase
LLPSGTAFASTWNVPLIEELAALHGQEMLRKGSDVLLSPGMNIHRDPLCGRNFEYFSEDPVVSGRIAAAVVRGVQSTGLAACPKHFAANNQETNRTRNDSRVSERALREIYLRGFEICVREAAPRVIMTSYNQINGVWAHYHHDLATVVLRGEWGYEGTVITDWWIEESADPDFPALADNAYRVRAQVDVLMPGGVKRDGAPQAYADTSIHARNPACGGR